MIISPYYIGFMSTCEKLYFMGVHSNSVFDPLQIFNCRVQYLQKSSWLKFCEKKHISLSKVIVELSLFLHDDATKSCIIRVGPLFKFERRV